MKLFRTNDDTSAEDETAQDERGDTAISQYPAAPASAYPGGGTTSYPATGTDQPRPTFTPTGPAADGTPHAPAIDATPAVDESRMAFAADADASSAALPVDEPAAALPVDEPAAAFRANEPLLANTTGMRASWQKVQAEFVDDPQAAVMDAADLIEQTAQSLVDALRQRQRQLRVLSGGAAATGDATAVNGTGSAASNGAPDTEHLRLMMRRYRTLFDQLCNA